MVNLFALTDDAANRIVKFSISSDVQIELNDIFRSLESSYVNTNHEIIEFDGKYKPESNEVLVINNYDDINGLVDATNNPITIHDIIPTPEVFNTIKALFVGLTNADGEHCVLIQHFNKKRIISTNGLSIFHSNNVYKKIEGLGVTIDNNLTAILKGNSLMFRSFHHLRQILDLSEYYIEATDVDIRNFATLNSFYIDDVDKLIEISDKWIRRKLWLISQNTSLQSIPITEIKRIALNFNIMLNTDTQSGNEKIIIPKTKKELKVILRFLDEDYYKSPILQNIYLTNSKRQM